MDEDPAVVSTKKTLDAEHQHTTYLKTYDPIRKQLWDINHGEEGVDNS